MRHLVCDACMKYAPADPMDGLGYFGSSIREIVDGIFLCQECMMGARFALSNETLVREAYAHIEKAKSADPPDAEALVDQMWERFGLGKEASMSEGFSDLLVLIALVVSIVGTAIVFIWVLTKLAALLALVL